MQYFNSEQFLILVVDDIAQNLQVIGDMLEEVGYETTFATNGEQALERVQVAEPDLILLDLRMPQMNGLEVCQVLKNQPKLLDIPVIFLTASNQKEHLVNAFNQGAVDYITKPFNSLELLSRVRTHLELKYTRDQLKNALNKQVQLTENLRKLSTIDALTNVWNERQLLYIGQHEVNRAKQYHRDLSILTIELDQFKKIHETYGQTVGDQVLKTLAKTLLKLMRNVDHFGRLSSAIFMVIMPETEHQVATKIAENIRDSIAHLLIPLSSADLKITVSIGSTIYQQHQTLDDMLQQAINALSQAKNQGGNCVVVA